MTPLVLLPGMMCDARLFGPQIAGLSGRTLHFPPLTGADTVQGLAAQILHDAPPRFALAGLSMGGIVAMEVVAQAPDRVTHLALLDTNPKAETPQVQARRAPQIEKVQAGGLEAVMRDEMKPNYLTNGPNRTAILDLCMDMARSLGPQAFVSQSRALRARPDQQESLARVTVPTLILCGRDDTLCPVDRHELMHALIPHSTLHIIENAGHLPTLEQPDQTTAALRHWLEA
jgi:pimeloyl-ACP methyl ester carboxylesterase